MKILALEFSTAQRSVAALEIDGGQAEVIAAWTEPAGRKGRAGSPFVLLEPLFSHGLQIEDIGGLAIGLGPGSYTGIRSALAIAQGWNLALNTLAVGVSTMEAIAWQAWRSSPNWPAIEVIIDAQRNEVYSAEYILDGHGFKPMGELRILPKPMGRFPLVGPDAKRYSPDGIEMTPTAEAIGKLAASMSFGPPEVLEPIYLRETTFVKAPAIRHA